jgi:hypothetical protein
MRYRFNTWNFFLWPQYRFIYVFHEAQCVLAQVYVSVWLNVEMHNITVHKETGGHI